ncbi:hypothetical protein COU59_01995 [Candidatus Pacearchaeota archaeon CG10_big_fil_rev_8_21_14_0_10_34_12]|nr:MAG: hypothetical protein COU59_01995 [Candidatus Pacearchaeota archaeon CG10_big_fil_rev_8_21_14_0_10_34_12]
MISRELAKYSMNNLYKRKTRSMLTIISILAGIATIFIFISFGLGLYQYINSFVTSGSADKITVMSKGGAITGTVTFGLTDDDLDAVKKTSGVYDAAGYYVKTAEVKSKDVKKYVFVGAMDLKKMYLVDELTGLKIDEGRGLQQGEKGKAVLGYNYKIDDKIFPKGLDVNDEIEIQGQKAKIVGFYQEVGNPADDSNIYVTEEFMEDLYPDIKYYYMIIARGDVSNITRVVDNVEKSLQNERGLKDGQEDFDVASFEQLLDSYSSALNIVVGFIILIALISVLVSAINTSNTMITSVLERMKELGVIKSIGARNSEILGLFLFESGVLGLVAGILGVMLGFGLTEFAGYILRSLGWGFLQPGYSIWLFIGCVIFATFTGAVSGVIPAINASRIRPVEALRYE